MVLASLNSLLFLISATQLPAGSCVVTLDQKWHILNSRYLNAQTIFIFKEKYDALFIGFGI